MRAVLTSLAIPAGLGIALFAVSFGRMGESVVAATATVVMAAGFLLVRRSSMPNEDYRRTGVGYALVVGALLGCRGRLGSSPVASRNR